MRERTPKSPETLRSQRWFAPDDLRSFGHRSRMKQMGLAREEFVGRPVIGIVNTWNAFNTCHSHFPERVEEIRRGVLMAGGLPVELPALSLGEQMMKPTTMLYRNFLAMAVEETVGCDTTTPTRPHLGQRPSRQTRAPWTTRSIAIRSLPSASVSAT